MALLGLCGVVGGVGYVGQTAYRAATDSFVAPMILSADSDVVVDSKVKLTELEMDRARTAAQIEGIDGDLAGIEQGVVRLTELEGAATKALEWTRDMNAHRSSAGTVQLGELGQQAATLAQMLAKQRELTQRAQQNLSDGIITRTEFAKEEQALDQTQLALLENARTRVQAELTMHEVRLAGGSLAGRRGAAPMPEVLAAQDQLVRIEIDLSQRQAEQRSKLAERKALVERLAKLDELGTQMRSRPLFRAVAENLDVAFVPYTQLDGVKKGAQILDCTLAFFACRSVGTVLEVVPGEVTLSDPWGNPARGQYAVLDLLHHESAKSKSLRVRWNGPSAGPSTAPSGEDSARAVSGR